MKKTKEKKPCHLTYEQRCAIQTLLEQKKSISYIASSIGKSPSTISREIRNRTEFGKLTNNDCALRVECKKTQVCGSTSCKRLCRSRKCCIRYCKDYVKVECPDLKKPPHVCNGCVKRGMCHYNKRFYDAKNAEKKYRETLRCTRDGFDLTGEQIEMIDTLVSPLILKGLSPFHIKQTLGDKLPISESTIRRMIDRNELSARNIDLRNKVKRRPRSKRKMHNEIPLVSKVGHFYKDYLRYISDNDVFCVQMDCVEGCRQDSAVLLTLHFPIFHMQLAFIMEEHTSKNVVATLDKIEDALGPELFAEVFQVILTDNGHEFSDITGIERSVYGGIRTKVFFCDPNRSDEKGACENNHKLIRYVIPKGTSLDSLTQEKVHLMMNHINSYCRKGIHGKTPYALAMNVLPEDFFILLGLEEIPSEEVNLTPSLLVD